MADVSEIIKEMRSNAQDVRFGDACKVADAYFGRPRQKGTSHRIWKMPWAGDPRVNLQEGSGGKAKAYQVRQVRAIIQQNGLAGDDEPPVADPDEETPLEDGNGE